MHWQWCKTYGFETYEKYYEYFVKKEMRILQNDRVQILQEFSIQRQKLTVINRIQFCQKRRRFALQQMLHAHLTHEQRRKRINMWKNQETRVSIFLVVIGALGMVSKNIARCLKIIGFDELEKLWKVCLLANARILRKVLD